MSAEQRPGPGDLVQYRDPVRGTGGHVARIRQRRGASLVVRSDAGGRPRRIEIRHVDGWWPKGCRYRSPAARRPVETTPGGADR